MKKLIFLIFAIFLPVLISSNFSYSQNTQDKIANQNFNIEGVFICDWNGTYYVRQIDNEVFWYGEGDKLNPEWSNVAHGIINGNVLTLTWADVPKGSIMQKGSLVIDILSNDNFVKTSQTGDNFGSSNWNRKTE